MQCNKERLFFFFCRLKILTAFSISFNSLIPVDNITLVFKSDIFFKYGILSISPEGILNIFNFIFFKKSILSLSNAEQICIILFFSQYFLIF